jgi:hypothetical protein
MNRILLTNQIHKKGTYLSNTSADEVGLNNAKQCGSYLTENRCVYHKYYLVNLSSDVKDNIVYPEKELELIDIFSGQIFSFVALNRVPSVSTIAHENITSLCVIFCGPCSRDLSTLARYQAPAAK